MIPSESPTVLLAKAQGSGGPVSPARVVLVDDTQEPPPVDDVVIVNEFAVENGMVVAEIGINSTTKFRIVPHGYDHAACLWPPFSWWETVMFTRPVCRRSTAKLVRDDVYGKPFNLLRVSGDGSLSPRLTTLRIVFPHGLRWADARASKDHQLTLSVDLLTHSSYFRDCHALRTIACMQTDAVCVTFNPSTGDVVRTRPSHRCVLIRGRVIDHVGVLGVCITCRFAANPSAALHWCSTATRTCRWSRLPSLWRW